MMRRLFSWVSVALMAALVWLGWSVWQQRSERDVWQQRVEVAARRVAELKARQKAMKPSTPVATERATTTRVQLTSPKLPAPKGPAEAEAERLGKLRVAWQERMNALNGFGTGFIALHLPPDTVARAKELLLQHWADNAGVNQKHLPVEQRLAAWQQSQQQLDEAMTALVGREPYDELRAYQDESHYDWTIGTDMWDAGVPLTSDQLHALCFAIVQTSYDDTRPRFAATPQAMPDSMTWLSPQDQALVKASARFLTPPQQEALRQSLMDENRYNAAMRGFARQQQAIVNATR